jgi:hypothetical protein
MFAAALTLIVAASPDAGTTACGPVRCEAFKTARAAFDRVLERLPVVLAVGEYHEIEGGPKVKSAISRFTHELLPALEGKATSLVVETWMTNGRCGEVEKAAVAQVKKVTQRPETTEDEVTTLMDKAYAQGIANHILIVDCDEYRAMLNAQGGLDAEKSLLLVRRKVEEKALEVREKKEGGLPGKVLILYGGALHNDLHPLEGWESYSFGPALSGAIDGGYVELDLVVPEFGANDDDLVKEKWFAPALKLAGTNLTVLVAVHPEVYAIVFPRKKAAKRK